MPKTTAKPAAPKPAVLGTYGTMYFVKDMKKSVAWFTEKLGVKPGSQSPEWTEFPLAGHALCLRGGERKAKDVGANGILIIHVAGIRELVEGLKAKGAVVKDEISEVHPGSYSATISDPDGNILSLYEGPKPSA